MMTLRNGFGALLVVGAFLVMLPSDSAAQKRQRDRITREEILASPQKDMDLFAVIRSLRPHFLEPPKGVRSLGGSNQMGVSVYIDGKRDTGIDALRTIMAVDVDDVRYMEPSKSSNEFGPRAAGGAVVVKLRKESKEP
jgi:hypothetical protein